MGRFETDDQKTLGDILESSSLLFQIPLNQRKYDWEHDQIEQFWNDVLKVVKEQSYHYLGVLSLIEGKGKTEFKEYKVIDGQQRLITTLLLVSAIRDIYIALGEEESAKEIQKKYLLSIQVREGYRKLTSCRIDQYTFRELVDVAEIKKNGKLNIVLNMGENIFLERNGSRTVTQDENEYINKKMTYAYEYFYCQIIEKYEEMESVSEKIEFLYDLEECLRKIEIIMIISENKDDLYLFFDSLNNRGLQLNQMDIVRNDLLEIISNYESDVKDYSILWDELTILLDDYDKVKFLKYYYICSKHKIFYSKQLPSQYEEYFQAFDRKEDIKKEIEKMIEYGKIYSYLFNKTEDALTDTHYDKNLVRINRLGQQACHSFLMDYFYEVKDDERKDLITTWVEKMMYRRIICNKSTKGLDGIFRDLIKTKETSGRYNDDNIIEHIKENTPNNDQFKNNFINREWGDDKVTIYTLRKYEYFLKEDNVEGAYHPTYLKSRKKVTLEHILPKNYNEAWKQELDISDKEFRLNNNKIGNLVLLENNINSSIKDKLFRQKVEGSEYYSGYQSSDLEQVKLLARNYEEWNLSNIDERTLTLSEAALEIWNL